MKIIRNGSKWAGDDPDDLPTLMEVLKKHPLCPSFALKRIKPRQADYIRPLSRRNGHGDTVANGNFIDVSHFFYIIGYHTETEMEELRQAIETNLKTFKQKNTPRRGRQS